jgi:hypothetical protein
VEYDIDYAVLSGVPEFAGVAVVKAPGEFCYLKMPPG